MMMDDDGFKFNSVANAPNVMRKICISNERYEELQKTKEEALKGIKEAGLGLMKSVKAAKGKAEL